MISITVNQLGNRDDFIALPFYIGNQGIQCVRRVFCPIMAQDDGAVSQVLVGANGTDDGIHAVIPVSYTHLDVYKRQDKWAAYRP